ncbi:methionyl-tRNA formyltransferase [Alkalibacillus haloalkaliphilus]|uniref:Methionyl-tRNA formyltransferase n=1 Tax=Alkalibacillus haloalkaliphilus TaxID=94136 RepID=A0A511W1E3_9BACI|nr:methionyl-tRNA formyltransferase [Alkalibacillus haloalkaliphilus]GEN44864.1 methionyl-tRNA formyltransferase [Alkalibacillus haloalkaliphilus]
MTKRIVFMGTPDFSVPVLERIIEQGYDVAAVVTQPDRPKGRKKVLTPSPVKECALKHDLSVLQPEKIRHDYRNILDYKPDLIVTAAYGQILPKEILEEPPFGCINVHASLLPKLRGGAPIHYSILEGHDETGVTIMYMVEALDAGAMISKDQVKIEEADHVGTLHDKLSEVGANLLVDTLPKLFAGDVEAEEQNHDEATFAYNIKREQERIDWNKSQQEIYNHIRGLHPWPVAFTTYQGQTVKLWWGEKVNQTIDQIPGTIVTIDDQVGILVATGDQKLINITELQPAGKKRMKTVDFLRGSKDYFEIGEKLGD